VTYGALVLYALLIAVIVKLRKPKYAMLEDKVALSEK
jgi:hypothetical protein